MNELLPLKIYKRSLLEYTGCDNGFSHNYERDLQLFLIWENGRQKDAELIGIIQKKFKILYCAEIIWSNDMKVENINRLYKAEIDSKNNKLEQVGDGPFLAIVVEDANPRYGYTQSLDGTIAISNLNIVDTKTVLRNILGENYIHSSSGIDEFFLQSYLLFGTDRLREIIDIAEWDENVTQIQGDLYGANGWNSLEEFLITTDICADFVILRNYEYLPNDFWDNDSDIDLLCTNIAEYRSISNAHKRSNGISGYMVKVGGKTVPLDIRYIGDNYYDSLWQKSIIDKKKYYNKVVPIPSNDDYFFSLLYHCKLQKHKVKPNYIDILMKTAKSIGYNITEKKILDNESAANVIDGYLKGNGYTFVLPLDRGVHLNKDVYKHIMQREKKQISGVKDLLGKSMNKLYSLLPKFVKMFIPKNLKLAIRKLLD